ncbi:MAG: efflux RND transporter periplasmic adaptor subunit, partial [Phycisphaerae bacterium]|nr:efflux RND transporter periplasmic adaptor subunit [Phycisphaerae bacterium]
VETLEKQSVPEVVTCNADVAFNGGRYAHLASRAPGIITEVRVDLGATVDAGEVLAVVDSSDIGSAKAAFLQARSLVDLWEKTHAREQSLFEQNVGTERDVLEAETRLVESRVQLGNARQRLQNLGLSERDLEVVAETNDTSSMLPLRAAFPGIVVERHAVPGEVVTTARSLFAVADTQTMWVMLDVYETDVARLERGQRVTMRVDAMPDRTFTGELTWISAEVDRRTRTIQARAEVENPDGLLRANMFGRAEITVRTIEEAVLVPASAVQWDGCCNVVFVRHTDTIYQPYKVTLGYKQGERFVVEDGVPAGEAVVTQGSFLLKTEILKGNIGAGCCEVDPGANQ